MLQCNDYLTQCKNNLQKTSNITDENLDELNYQRENLLNINKKFNDMNNKLDETETTLHKMKNPFCCFNILKLNKKSKIDFNNKKILMIGTYFKRSKILKVWNKRYYKLYDNYLIYRHKQSSNKKYYIECSNSFINVNLYNQIYKDNSLSIDNNYLFFDIKNDFTKFISLINNDNIKYHVSDIINESDPWTNNSTHNILDDIHDSLDDIYYKNVIIRNELDDQNKIITEITNESDNTNSRLRKNINIIKSIN